MRLPKFWNIIAAMLDRIPSGWGIPLLVIIGALFWLGVMKLLGV